MERHIRLNWQDLVSEAKRRRKAQRFTQEKLAVIARVSKPTLNKFEQGSRHISIDNALKILRVLGLADVEI